MSNWYWSRMLERVELRSDPLLRFWIPFTPHCLPNLRNALRGMRKVQNAHGAVTMQVNKSLQPLRPIHDRCHLPRR